MLNLELRMTREQTYKAPYHFDVASRWQYSPNTFSGSGFHVQYEIQTDLELVLGDIKNIQS